MDQQLSMAPQNDILEGFRLSPQQKWLWSMAHNNRGYCSQCAIRIEGTVSPDRLRAALQTIVERHESLRTTFRCLAGMEFPIQALIPAAPVRLEVRNLGDLTNKELPSAIDEQIRRDAQMDFDYEDGPLVRFTLLQFAPAASALLITLSSLCGDAATLKNLYAQIAALCAREESEEEPGGEFVQYIDYSEWQNELLEGDAGAAGREHWKPLSESSLTAFRLPLEPAPQAGPPLANERISIAATPRLLNRLNSLVKDRQSTLQDVLLTTLSVLAWRLCDRKDFVIGCLFDGRQMSGCADALGLFAKYLPIEPRLEEDYTFGEALKRHAEQLSQARGKQDYYAFEQARTGAGAGVRPMLMPVKFEWHEAPEPIQTGNHRFWLERLSSFVDSFELKLSGIQSAEGLTLEFHYDSLVYSSEAVAWLVRRYLTLLEHAAESAHTSVKQLELMDQAERRQVIESWNQTQRPYPATACLHELFEHQADQIPDQVAVICGEQTLLFRELNEQANQLARHLRGFGVGPELSVGLFMERSVDLLVAILGILKAGGAYVPLDPGYPKARLVLMINEADVKAVVTQERLAGLLTEIERPLIPIGANARVFSGEEKGNLPLNVTPENLAYIIFTSGSTGKPKGVMVKHGSAVNLAFALREEIFHDKRRSLRVGLNASLAFDASVKQLIQIVHGHSVCIIPDEVRPDAAILLNYLEQHQVDALDCTPSHLNLLLAGGLAEHMERLPLTLLIGGEALDERLWRQLGEARGKRCFNVYGPTECTVDATAMRIREGTPTIGRPIANVKVYVLDANLDPAPIGVPGHLYVAGAGLARGYLGRPDLTGEGFLPDPFSASDGTRMYKTGDQVRYLADGRLEYLGRFDEQVKFQGFRIELGEIEGSLREHPAVREAAVVVVEDDEGRERLVGHVLPKRQQMKTIDGHVRYPLPNGKAIAHNNKNESDYLYQEIFEKKTYLKHGIEVPPNAVVFDVGANIGMFSLFIADHFPDARIYAFEPLRPIFDSLRINAELYVPTIKLFPYGISSANETASFTYYPHYSMMSGQTAYSNALGDIGVIKKYLANQQTTALGEVSELLEHVDELLSGRFAAEVFDCRVRRLSEVIAEEGVERIDLLKVDVQRAELNVLRGIGDEDWPKIHQVVMEVHDGAGEETEGHLKEIIALLKGHGFDVAAEQDGLLIGTDRHNLYALRRGHRPREVEAMISGTGNQKPASPPVSAILTIQELNAFLRERLPEYMIPAAIMLLNEIPLTISGKIDRTALAASSKFGAQSDSAYLAPRTGVERQIAAIWQQALGVERVGSHDNFFDLGGHSLLLVQVHRKLCEAFQTDLTMIEIFQHPSVASLAEFLNQRGIEMKPEARFKQTQERAKRVRKAVNRQKQVLKGWKNKL